MTEDEFKNMKEGDTVTHISGGEPYIVTGHYGNRATAVCTVDITNPPEWRLISKEEKLKPCPFCGGANVSCHPVTGDDRWFVLCKNLYCQIKTVGESKEEAISRWNKRS